MFVCSVSLTPILINKIMIKTIDGKVLTLFNSNQDSSNQQSLAIKWLKVFAMPSHSNNQH